MPFYYEKIYWILLIPVLILSIYAQIKVSSTFKRASLRGKTYRPL